MPLAPLNQRILVAVVAAFVLLSGQPAWAGRLTPQAEDRLRALPPGGTLAVIVEMRAQADPVAAAGTAPRGQRVARRRAVRDVLQHLATQDQASIRGLLAREQGLGNVTRMVPFWVINGLAVTATEPVIRAIAARTDVFEVRPDAVIQAPRPIHPAAGPALTGSVSEWNIDQIRAPEVWALDPNYTGIGIVVGSFDTGVDLSHPDLQPRYRGNHSISWFDPYGEHASPVDPNGHGTHTTGTIVGGDASGSNIGVAPGARWIAAKAWNDQGIGLASAFHQIFEWFLAPGGDPVNAPDVVNSSWGFAEAGCIPEFEADVLALRAAGIFPAFAAGNDGPESGSVHSPGANPETFAVGATDFFDDIGFFSGQGPSPCGGIVKPNLSAPGVSILSAIPGGEHIPADGTSMATPHVSGAVAVLRSINPALTVEELETVLELGAVDLGVPGPDNIYGAGRLDLFVSAQIVLGGPDRPIVKIDATDAEATEVGQTTATLTVSRTGSTDEALTVHYAVGGTATAGSDYSALSESVTIPTGSATATIVVAALEDTLPEPDETVVVSLSADSAYIVGSPGSATATITSDELPPDMIIAAFSAPTPVGTISPFTVTDTTRNQGGGPAGASTTRFYLSSNATLDGNDALLGSRSIPALAPGASSSASTTLTVPAGTAVGTYFLIARADATEVLQEGQEANNTAVGVVQVRGEVIVQPNAIDLATPPTSFTIQGDGFVNLGFGLPIANFVRGGFVLAQARATAMTSTSLTVPFPTAATALAPNLTGLSAGPVEVQVYLQTEAAGYGLLASGTLSVTDSRGVSGIAPAMIDLATPPADFIVTGAGFADLGFGRPVVNFLRNGAVVAQARATEMTGTSLTVPFPTPATALAPNLPGLAAGTVTVQVYLQTGPTSYSLFGSTTLTVTDTRPAPGVSAITPGTIDLAQPTSFTITGVGFADLGFGLPVVNFSRNGAIVAQARATSMTTTTLTVPFPSPATALVPNLPGLSAGTVLVQVYLQTGPGSFALLGSTTLTVTDSRPTPGVGSISPSEFDLADPPELFTITGSGFADLGFGRPIVNFTRNGAVLAQARATAMTATTLTVPFPTAATAIASNLPGLSAGPVVVQVYLQSGPGAYSLLGSAMMTVTDTRPTPGVSSIDPSGIDLADAPETFAIAGGGFADLGFGLPIVNFTRNGAVLAQARATAMTPTSLTVPFPTAATAIAPNLPGLSAGTVVVQVYLQSGPGSYQLLGGAMLTVNDTR
jgi:subtilisin family serine protease